MNTWRLMMGFAAATGLVLACSSDPEKSEDDSGDGGSATTTTTGNGGATTTTTTTVTSTTSGMMSCPGNPFQFNDPTCGGCMENACCSELEACGADQTCVDCVTNPNADPTVCSGNAGAAALEGCLSGNCSAQCGGGASYPICESGFATGNEACSTCLSDACCDEATACFNDATCNSCILNNTGCDNTTLDEELDTCATDSCGAECG